MSDRLPMRPRDSASLLLADLSGAAPRFLMGRRAGGHVFMAHARVFPGGRLERGDGEAHMPARPHRADLARLADELGPGAGDRRAAAFAGCALRETREETGLALPPELFATPLRYIARAITPPGQARRYDTRFFLAIVDPQRARFGDADGELSDIGWYGAERADDGALHPITNAVMRIALARLDGDRRLDTHPPVPCYRVRDGRRTVEFAASDWTP